MITMTFSESYQIYIYISITSIQVIDIYIFIFFYSFYLPPTQAPANTKLFQKSIPQPDGMIISHPPIYSEDLLLIRVGLIIGSLWINSIGISESSKVNCNF